MSLIINKKLENICLMKIEEIWLAYRAALKRFIHAKVSNEADVDDLLQEILIKTHNNIHTLKEQKSVKAWLFQIANRSIIDYYRKQDRSKEYQEVKLNSHDDSESSNRDLTHCIIPFINALPSENARLLTAIDINNQSQKQYAEQLGISYSTLKSRVQKSRILLREIFDGCCHFKLDKNGKVYDYEIKTSNDIKPNDHRY